VVRAVHGGSPDPEDVMVANTVGSPDVALNQVRRFFTTLVRDAPEGAVVALTTPPAWRLHLRTADDLEPLVRQVGRLHQHGADVYVHCALLNVATVSQRPGRGTSEDAAALTAFWCDIDLEKSGNRQRYVPDRATALRLLARCPIRPTMRVWSGRGFHPWWCLREPFVITDPTTRAQAERLVRRWQAYVRSRLDGYALDATHDLARVLRVPGTTNTKYATPVVLEDASGPRVDPAELEDICAQLPQLPDAPPAVATADVTLGDVDPAAEPPAAKFRALCARSPLFAQLWRRELAPHDASQSGYDCRLATLAAIAAWTDAELLALLVAHRREAGRPPHRPDYYARTIARARRSAAWSGTRPHIVEVE